MDSTKRIADFVTKIEHDKLPPEVVQAAKAAFIDCLGVTVAGAGKKALSFVGK